MSGRGTREIDDEMPKKEIMLIVKVSLAVSLEGRCDDSASAA